MYLTFVSHCNYLSYNVLTRRTVVYLYPCLAFPLSVESICDAPQQFCFVHISVYVYRDIWPLAMYTESPVDGSEGALLWTKLVLLFTTAVIIPLVVPRQYVPVDPKVNNASAMII
jgi:hypothetical protein